MPVCNRCSEDIEWPQPYQQGQKPLNPDGTPHQCQEVKQTTLATGGSKSNKIPMDKATEVYTLAESFLVLFKEHRGIEHDASPNKLTSEQELQAIESFFKTLSGYYKI